MTNFQVYKKTLSFSFLSTVVNLFALAALGGCTAGGFIIADKYFDRALIGLAIGFAIGVILCIVISIFGSNPIKAAQISMMVKGVTEDELPKNTLSTGFKELNGRFGKITAFFVITNAIKGIFRQIGHGFTRLTSSLGGNVGSNVGSAIDSAVQTVIEYLCDCCLGWVLYRKEENSFKAACEGSVIFFKHGKTLARNVGRIFGIGLLSLIVIGGAVMGISYAIFLQFPAAFASLANEIAAAAARGSVDIPAWLTNPNILSIAIAGIGALVIWSMFHSVFIRPFILVGVLRNFMAAGISDIPTEEDLNDLASKSPRFAKLQSKAK